MKGSRLLWGMLLAVVTIAGCAPAEPARPHGPSAQGDSFYFVQITDPHWGARDGIPLTRKAVDLINSLPVKVEFVAVTGDLFSNSIQREDLVDEACSVMKGLKVPVHYVPGNHDILQDDVAGTARLFEEHFGPLDKMVDVRGVMCLFLCTESMAHEARSPGHIQREKIERMLEPVRGKKPVLLFMHRPPLRDMLAGSDGAVTWDDRYDTRWAELFERHPEIKAVFAGHFHRDEMSWIGAVPVHVAGALARFWDRQPSFRLYQYQNGRVDFWSLYPERTAPRVKR